jgi:hypothetical protein
LEVIAKAAGANRSVLQNERGHSKLSVPDEIDFGIAFRFKTFTMPKTDAALLIELAAHGESSAIENRQDIVKVIALEFAKTQA